MKAFYHSADLDGHCSGAIIKTFYPDCEMIGIDYGDEFPWERITKDEMVFMVDFSLQPFSDMEKLNDLSLLVWIDHHKSAIEDAHKRGFLARGGQSLEIGKAACELTWRYLLPNDKMPESVYLLGRYDVWDHSDKRTLPFQYGMRLYSDTRPESFIWSNILHDFYTKDIILSGEIVLSYINSENAKYARVSAFETELDGLRCIAINRVLANSKLFDAVWDQEKYDAMVAFGFHKNHWSVSLYSDKPDIDVSIIAKNHGGGGHKGAAGFQCDELPFRPKRG